jgi:2'-5' RNA ligase
MGKNVSKMETRRIFAAIDIPGDVRAAISNYVVGLKRVDADRPIRWEKTEKLHITLKFIAEARPDQVTALDEGIKTVSKTHSPFDAEIARTGAFPNTKSPRVLWLGIGAGAKEMTSIVNDLEALAKRVGLPVERREFHPHLTIGRIKGFRKAPDISDMVRQGFGPARFRVENLTLYESHLARDGLSILCSRHIPALRAAVIISSPDTSRWLRSPQGYRVFPLN